jgi:SAM-dependent methyltransferase
MQTEAESPNADQIAYWNGEASARWLARQENFDVMIEPLTRRALELAAPLSGEHVIDIGCGCGATVLELARRVGPGGEVLGVDVSAPMLGRARERVTAAGLAQAKLTEADASSAPFRPAAYDLLFSRFGVMFFRNPVPAFANLKRALKSGGRVAFVCWQPLKENPTFLVPLKAAGAFGPPRVALPPDEPGPFAFGDSERVRRILGEAGFSEIGFTPWTFSMRWGGPGDFAAAEEYASQLGPVSRLLADLAPETLPAARAAIREALRDYDSPDGVMLGAAVWLVSARA